ncbi:MAG: magnesium transporter [Candidatus Bathyarchaeia archaeon]
MLDINVGIILEERLQLQRQPLMKIFSTPFGRSNIPADSTQNETNSTQNSFYKAFRECLTSFTFDFIGLLAGFIFTLFLDIFMLAPWIIAVYPAILTARGALVGIFTGRLSTSLHIGTIYPKFAGNTRAFHILVDTTVVMNLIVSFLMSLIAMAFDFLFWGAEVGNFIDIMLNVIATMALGLTIFIPTACISFLSFKAGLDPDVVVYPIMSSVADALITIYYALIVAIFFLSGSIGRAVVITINIFYLALTALIVLRNIHDGEFIKGIKEILLTLIIVAFIVNVTGTFLGRISAIIEERREVYTVYPSLIDMIGDVGSVIGSTATTRLALGLINPSLRELKKLREHILGSWLSSLIILTTLSATSLVLNGLFETTHFAWLTSILIIVDIIAVSLILCISFLVSILTFKRSLDPDNFVIPIESSLADSITTLSLLLALLLIPG